MLTWKVEGCTGSYASPRTSILVTKSREKNKRKKTITYSSYKTKEKPQEYEFRNEIVPIEDNVSIK